MDNSVPHGNVVRMETIEFDHTPHYKTICDKKSHFSRASDALAEFVDNSIQACRDSSERKVSIHCFLSKNKSTSNSFLTITDNGCGMSDVELKCFAKYSFDQESRGIEHNINDRSDHISKFGVGAKEAGFFLGDKLRVVSRPNARDACLHELSMDEREYAARFEREENVYLGHIHRFKDVDDMLSSDGGVFTPDELRVTDLMDHVARQARQNPHFTMIILRLRPAIVPKFDERYQHIFNELATIYHYYLHPEHRPNTVLNEPKYQKPAINNVQSKSKSGHPPEDLPLPKALRSGGGHLAGTTEAPVESVIIVCEVVAFNVPVPAGNPRATQMSQAPQSYMSTVVLSVNLRDNAETSLMNRYMQRARHAFRFNLTIPDPSGRGDDTVGLPRDQLTQSTQFRAQGLVEKKVVEGILFYFPFYNGRESKPSVPVPRQGAGGKSALAQGASYFDRKRGRDVSSIVIPRKQHSSHLLESPGSRNPDEDDECDFVEPASASRVGTGAAEVLDFSDDEDDGGGPSALQRQQDSVFSVYWQNRLVPETVLDRIPCFKGLPSSSLECSNHSIAHNWRSRLKGFLFFDWTFHNISNNKLKFTVEPSLEAWLNEQLRNEEVVWSPSSAPTQLKRWLQGCHKYFDQEMALEDRANDLENLFRNPGVTAVQAPGANQDHCALMQLLGALPGADKLVSFFRTLVVSNNGAVCKLKSNKLVKLFRRLDFKTPGASSKLTKKKEIFGRIVAFQVRNLNPRDTEYRGSGVMLRYQREPVQLYGNMLEYSDPVPLAHLGDLNAIEEPSKKEMAKLVELCPHDVKFSIYRTNYLNPVEVQSGKSFSVVRNAKLLMLGLQIFDKNGNATCGKPQVSKACRYTVELRLKADGQPATVINKTDDLYVFDAPEGAEDAAVSTGRSLERGWSRVPKQAAADKSVLARAVYSFYDLYFRHAGAAKLVAHVIDTHVIGEPRTVLTKEITVVSEFLPVDRVLLLAEFEHMFPMGCAMPELRIVLQDCAQQAAKYEGEVRISVVAPEEPDLQFSMYDGEGAYITDVIIAVDDADNGEFALENCKMEPRRVGYRKINPRSKRDRPVLSSDAVETKDIKMVMTITVADVEGKVADVLGRPVEFCMKMCPGPPAILDAARRPSTNGDAADSEQVPPIELTATYGEMCPQIDIACFDQFMQRTAPDQGLMWKGMLLSQWRQYCVEGSQKSQKSQSTAPTGSLALLPSSPWFLVSTAGELTMRDVRVGVSGGPQPYIPPEGLVVEDTLYLLEESGGRLDPAAVDLDTRPSIPVRVTVRPNVVATSIRVLAGAEVLSAETPRGFTVGSRLDDLTLQVLDQHGSVMPFDSDCIFGAAAGDQARSTGIKISWASKEMAKKQKFLTSDRLPPLTLRTCVLPPDSAATEGADELGADVVEFSVYCVIRGAGELRAEFAVRLLPDAPVHWTILTPPPRRRKGAKSSRAANDAAPALLTACSEEAGNCIPGGIELDDYDSLAEKLSGICLVDKFGNRIDCTAAAPLSGASGAELSPIAMTPGSGVKFNRAGTSPLPSSQGFSAGLIGDKMSTGCKVFLKWQRSGEVSDDVDIGSSGSQSSVQTTATTLLKLKLTPQRVDGTLCYVLEEGLGLVVPLSLLTSSAAGSRLHVHRLLQAQDMPRLTVELMDRSSLSLPLYSCDCAALPGGPFGLQVSSEEHAFATHVELPHARLGDIISSPQISMSQARRSGSHRAAPPGVRVSRYTLPLDLKLRFHDRNGFPAVLRPGGPALTVQVHVLRGEEEEPEPVLELPALRAAEVMLGREAVTSLYNALEQRVASRPGSEDNSGDDSVFILTFRFRYSNDDKDTAAAWMPASVPKLCFHLVRLNVVTDVQVICLQPSDSAATQAEAMVVEGGWDMFSCNMTSDAELPPLVLMVATQNQQPLVWDSTQLVESQGLEEDSQSIAPRQVDPAVLRELFKFKFLHKKRALDLSDWYDLQPLQLPPHAVVAATDATGPSPVQQLLRAKLYDAEHSYFLLEPLRADSLSSQAQAPSALKIGRYDLTATYAENRTSLQELPAAAKKVTSAPFPLEVIPAPLAGIAPAAPSRLQGCVATNSRAPHIEASARVVASDLHFEARDRLGHRTSFPAGGVLVCTVQRCVQDPASSSQGLPGAAPPPSTVPSSGLLPKLKGAGEPGETAPAQFVASTSLAGGVHVDAPGNADCLLFAKKLPAGGFYFPCVELVPAGEEEGEAYRDGLVQLCFQFHASAEALHRHLAAAGASTAPPEFTSAFMLTTDQARTAQIKEMQRDVELLSTLVDAHDAEVGACSAAVEEVERELRRSIQTCRSRGVRGYLDDLDALTQREAATLHGQIRGQISDMRGLHASRRSNLLNASSMSANDSGMSGEDDGVRAPVRNGKYPSPSELLGYSGVIGLVLDVGFVDNYQEAFLLSWAGAPYMDSILVREDAVAQQMYRSNIKVWSLDQMRAFSVMEAAGPGERPVHRPRNREEVASGLLPLPPVVDPATRRAVEGNPAYLVNLVRLSAEHEPLRDTVFHSIYKNALLFDDIRTANAYRKLLLARKAQLPTIFTRDGHKVGADGLLNPRAGQGQRPESLPSIFGAMPDETLRNVKSAREELEELEKDDEALEEVEELVRQREARQEELNRKLADADRAHADPAEYSVHVQEMLTAMGVTNITVSTARRLLQHLDTKLAGLGLGTSSSSGTGPSNLHTSRRRVV